MIPLAALEGASKASQPCRLTNPSSKTLTELQADFRALRLEWSDGTPCDRRDYSTEIVALLLQVQRRPIHTASDAAIKMDIALQRTCWSAAVERIAFLILNEVRGYLVGLEDGAGPA